MLLHNKIKEGITQLHLVKSKKITTNQDFTSARFWPCFFSPFSNFKKNYGASITINKSELMAMLMLNRMTKKNVN